MSTEVEKTLATVAHWPIDDRLALLDGLWDNLLESGWSPDLTEEQKAELDRRLDDLDAHPEKVLTWEQVIQRLRLPQ